MSSKRHNHMHRRRRNSDPKTGQRQPDEILRARHQGKAYTLTQQQAHNQAPPLLGIAQRNKQKHSHRRAKLREHGNDSHLRHGYAKVRRNRR